MRWIMERQLEHGKEVHICFIDYSKAIDCINHELLWKTLLEMGIPKDLIQLLKGLYEDQSAVIRTEFGDTDRFKIKRSKAGLHLVPILIQPVCREDNEKSRNGRGKRRSENSRKDNLRYADDTTLMAGKKADLAKLIRRLKRESEKGAYIST